MDRSKRPSDFEAKEVTKNLVHFSYQQELVWFSEQCYLQFNSFFFKASLCHSENRFTATSKNYTNMLHVCSQTATLKNVSTQTTSYLHLAWSTKMKEKEQKNLWVTSFRDAILKD